MGICFESEQVKGGKRIWPPCFICKILLSSNNSLPQWIQMLQGKLTILFYLLFFKLNCLPLQTVSFPEISFFRNMLIHRQPPPPTPNIHTLNCLRGVEYVSYITLYVDICVLKVNSSKCQQLYIAAFIDVHCYKTVQSYL